MKVKPVEKEEVFFLVDGGGDECWRYSTKEEVINDFGPESLIRIFQVKVIEEFVINKTLLVAPPAP